VVDAVPIERSTAVGGSDDTTGAININLPEPFSVRTVELAARVEGKTYDNVFNVKGVELAAEMVVVAVVIVPLKM
jgi:hypothetical protein